MPIGAQTTAGSIVGTVTDPSGAVIAGAGITITNMGTNIAVKTTTDASGEYVMTPLEVGKYSVTVEVGPPQVGMIRRRSGIGEVPLKVSATGSGRPLSIAESRLSISWASFSKGNSSVLPLGQERHHTHLPCGDVLDRGHRPGFWRKEARTLQVPCGTRDAVFAIWTPILILIL
jgi:hypothetical protein